MKKQKVEVENATKLKMLDQDNIDYKKLRIALDLLHKQNNENNVDDKIDVVEVVEENNTEKENEFENN